MKIKSFISYSIFSLSLFFISIFAFEILFIREIKQRQIKAIAKDVTLKSKLVSMGLEVFPPLGIYEISGVEVISNFYPKNNINFPKKLLNKALDIENALCLDNDKFCPKVFPMEKNDFFLVEIQSPYEVAWMVLDSKNIHSENNNIILIFSLLFGIGVSMNLFLHYEVNKPLNKLSSKLSQIPSNYINKWQQINLKGTSSINKLIKKINIMGDGLVQRERERNIMIAGVAHDLKSPLARMKMRLGNDYENNKMSIIDINSLESIIDKFLIYANNTNSENKLEIPIKNFILELAGQYEENINLEILDTYIKVQPIGLSRALKNIIENAIDYGLPPFLIRTINSENNKFLKIMIWDSGKGIPEEKYKEAIEPFQRLDNSRSGKGNCGLGLSIASNISKEHGGELSFETNYKNYRFATVITLIY